MAAASDPDASGVDRGWSFAERLDHLFRTVPDSSGRLWSNRSAAAELTRRGHTISHAHIGNLRFGRADPRHSDMQALADLFDQPVSYFTDTVTGVEQQLRLALADPSVRLVALRMADARLSPRGAEAIIAMIEQVQRLEADRNGGTGTT